jgi:hypothetical protein
VFDSYNAILAVFTTCTDRSTVSFLQRAFGIVIVARFHSDQKEHGSFEAICIIRNLDTYNVTVLVNGEHFKNGCVVECIENGYVY